MLRDVRHAIRLLAHSKMWTLVVVLSLALGIGANTAIFSAINGLVLQTLPVDRPETLVRLQWAGENDMGNNFSEYGAAAREGGVPLRTTFPYRIYEEFRKANQTLDDLFACAPQGQVNVVSDDRAELATALIASGNYFNVLGVPAAVGRTFTPDDDRRGAPPVAVISDGYWKRRFGGDRGIVGRAITINGTPVIVVGVTPRSFTGVQQVMTDASDITLPLSLDPRLAGAPLARPDGNMMPARLDQPTSWWLQIVGRLKPGVTADQVRGNLAGVFQASAREGWDLYVGSLSERDRSASQYQNRTSVPSLRATSASRGVYDVTPDAYRSMALLSVVVALVLFIVCANVANLLLSRAASRQREISVRVSVGASRPRLIRQLLTESVLLAALGAAAGVLIAYWGRTLLPANLGASAPIDWRVFVFVGGLTLLTGVIFGIAPALRASRVDIAAALKDGARGMAGGRSRLGKTLLVAQVAVSLVLLVGAGLFLQTVQNLRRVDVGFETGNLLLVPVNPGMLRYELPRIQSLYTDMLQRLAAVPGVRAVALSNPALLSGGISSTSFFVQGRPVPPRSRENTREGGTNNIYRVIVAPSFFETMGMHVSDGRGLMDRDTQTAPKVAVINEQAVRKFFPRERAIGQRFGQTAETSGDTEIVGVLRDAKYNSLRDDAPPTMYVPYRQARLGAATFELRTALEPMPLVPAVRETIRQIDPNLPILNITTQTDQIERRFAQEKIFAQAYAWFGGLALLIASIGLFGLMSYTVARRTNEIGIRMALGADRRTVLAMVMRESLVLVVVGVVLGAASALAAGRLVESLLFGLPATDAVTLAGAVIVMVAVSALAGYLPARTAAGVDPMIALRYE